MQAAISVFGDKKHGFWGEEPEHCGGRTCTRTMRPKVSFSPSSPAGEALFQRLRNQEAENKDLRKQVRRLEKKADRLSKNIADMAAKISHLEDRLEQAHRLLSGKKSERYTPADNAQQGQLSGEEPEAVEPEEEEEEYVPVKRKRRGKNKPVRGPIPDHLPREVIRLEPEGSTAGMKYIGEEVTEYLEYVPGFTRVVRIVRPKYVVCKEPRKGVVIAPLPKRVIPKGKAGLRHRQYFLFRSTVAEACHTEGEGGSGVVGVFGGSQICRSYAAIPAAEEVSAPWREAIGCYNGGLDCEGSDVSGSVRRCVA